MKLRSLVFGVSIALLLAAGQQQARAQESAPASVIPQAINTPSVATPAPLTTNAPASANSDPDIRDIPELVPTPNSLVWVVYLAAALLLGGLAFAAWRYFRRPKKTEAKLPFEIALERLEAARPLMTPASVREYAISVSETIRAYIEQVFRERAAHRTTEEFLSDLLQQTGTPLARHRDRLAAFLQYCDLTKFARWQLAPAEMESMHESARAFVLDTRPQPEPAAVPLAGAPAIPPPAPQFAETP